MFVDYRKPRHASFILDSAGNLSLCDDSEPLHKVPMKLTPLACSGRLRLPYAEHGIVRVFRFRSINKLGVGYWRCQSLVLPLNRLFVPLVPARAAGSRETFRVSRHGLGAWI